MVHIYSEANVVFNQTLLIILFKNTGSFAKHIIMFIYSRVQRCGKVSTMFDCGDLFNEWLYLFATLSVHVGVPF